MDRIINVNVNGNYITKDNRYAGVQGEVNGKTLHITFDTGWDGFAKTATFYNSYGNNPVEVVFTADLLVNISESLSAYAIPIPGEAMEFGGQIEYVIDGYLNGVRQRTATDTLAVRFSSVAGEPAPATPTEIEQIQESIEKILPDIQAERIKAEKAAAVALNYEQESFENAKIASDKADEAETAAANAEKFATETSQHTEEASRSANVAERSASEAVAAQKAVEKIANDVLYVEERKPIEFDVTEMEVSEVSSSAWVFVFDFSSNASNYESIAFKSIGVKTSEATTVRFFAGDLDSESGKYTITSLLGEVQSDADSMIATLVFGEELITQNRVGEILICTDGAYICGMNMSGFEVSNYPNLNVFENYFDSEVGTEISCPTWNVKAPFFAFTTATGNYLHKVDTDDYAAEVKARLAALEEDVNNPPKINETTGNWMVWDAESNTYVDTGYPSVGKGDKGDDGEDGTDGKDGVTPDIQIGTVTTLEAGSKATVELDESSTLEKPVFNFGIPQGSPGEGGSSTGDYVPSGGGKMTGDLEISKGIPNLKLSVPGSEAYAEVKKNAGTDVDLGTNINDFESEGNYTQLNICHKERALRLRVLENGVATGAYDLYHEGNKPTAEDVGAVGKGGDTMTGDLTLQPEGVSGYSKVKKNASADGDYGLQMQDYSEDGAFMGLTLCAKNQKIEFKMKEAGSDEYRYPEIYHSENKPTAQDVGALPGTGGNVTGQLNIVDEYAQVNMVTAEGHYTSLMKNGDGENDYGTILRDQNGDLLVDLKLSAEKKQLRLAIDGKEYTFYHEGNIGEVALPSVSVADNGKILRVVDGAWALELVADAEDGEF